MLDNNGDRVRIGVRWEKTGLRLKEEKIFELESPIVPPYLTKEVLNFKAVFY